MKLQSKGLLSLALGALGSTVFLLLRYAKVSPIIGSCFSFFSLSDLLMPLSGNLGFGFVSLLVMLRFGFRALFFGAPLTALVYHIPGVCASSYWALNNKLISLVLPLACMIAFLAHPVGFAAAPYSLYWLIPMVLYFVKEKTIFMHCLASTFIAHSVGSVLWLYTGTLSAAVWMSLIPVVAIERFVFAGGMMVVYYAVSYLRNRLLNITSEKGLLHD